MKFLWPGLGFIVGLVLGSFIKVLADRSLRNKSFLGRSYCVYCKKTLPWYDLFPVISYLFLKGKCRYCRKKIGREYLYVELISGLIFALIFWKFPLNLIILQNPYQLSFFFLDLVLKIFFVSVLLVLFITDLKKMFIPDRVAIPSIIITTIYLALIAVYKIGYLYFYLSQSKIGTLLLPPYSDYFQRHAFLTASPLLGSLVMAILIGGFFWLLIIITKGKGMGGGDVKLGALIGLVLGFPNSLIAMVLSFTLGAVVSIILILSRKKHFGESIPFGPFLVLGSLITLLWGNQILNWYLGLSTSF